MRVDQVFERVRDHELSLSTPAAHVACRECGLTIDVNCLRDAAPCRDAADTGGFAIDAAEVTFWGVCPSCQATSNAKTATA